jgi:tricorn protease-like protein
MGRVKVSIGIIIGILIFAISGIFIINHKTKSLLNDLDKLQAMCDQGRTEEAADFADSFNSRWESYQKIASIYVRNEKISSVQNSVSRLKPLIENENDELNAEFECARSSLQWIVESEIPKITNIL